MPKRELPFLPFPQTYSAMELSPPQDSYSGWNGGPQKVGSLEPVIVMLFEKKVFVDVIKLKTRR